MSSNASVSGCGRSSAASRNVSQAGYDAYFELAEPLPDLVATNPNAAPSAPDWAAAGSVDTDLSYLGIHESRAWRAAWAEHTGPFQVDRSRRDARTGILPGLWDRLSAEFNA